MCVLEVLKCVGSKCKQAAMRKAVTISTPAPSLGFSVFKIAKN
jgi:hypothetical protein